MINKAKTWWQAKTVEQKSNWYMTALFILIIASGFVEADPVSALCIAFPVMLFALMAVWWND